MPSTILFATLDYTRFASNTPEAVSPRDVIPINFKYRDIMDVITSGFVQTESYQQGDFVTQFLLRDQIALPGTPEYHRAKLYTVAKQVGTTTLAASVQPVSWAIDNGLRVRYERDSQPKRVGIMDAIAALSLLIETHEG